METKAPQIPVRTNVCPNSKEFHVLLKKNTPQEKTPEKQIIRPLKFSVNFRFCFFRGRDPVVNAASNLGPRVTCSRLKLSKVAKFFPSELPLWASGRIRLGRSWNCVWAKSRRQVLTRDIRHRRESDVIIHCEIKIKLGMTHEKYAHVDKIIKSPDSISESRYSHKQKDNRF